MNGTNKILVLNASNYSLIDEKTGEIREGVSVRFVHPESVADKDNKKGLDVCKGSLSADAWVMFTEVPGYYDAIFSIGVNRDGHSVLKLEAVDFASPLAI